MSLRIEIGAKYERRPVAGKKDEFETVCTRPGIFVMVPPGKAHDDKMIADFAASELAKFEASLDGPAVSAAMESESPAKRRGGKE